MIIKKKRSAGDGKVGIVGAKDLFVPTLIDFPFFENISTLSCGFDHSLIVDQNNGVFGFGFGQHGALGLEELKTQPTPEKVNFFSDSKLNVKKIQCGVDYTIFETD